MKTNRPFMHAVIPTILTALLLPILLLLVGCNNPIFYNRPSDEALINWLDGQKIVIEKGRIFDDSWIFRKEEVLEFEKLSISKDDQDVYSLHVRIDVYSGDRGLRIYAVFRYEFDIKEIAVRILSCETERILKLGKW